MKQHITKEKIVELYTRAIGETKLPEEVWKEIAKVNQIVLDQETGKISDGYHTFDELYEHRITLFIALCKQIQDFKYHGDIRNRLGDEKIVWCSVKHSDGSKLGDWFILGINKLRGKQITYHLSARYWNEVCEFAEVLDKAPEFDGHTPEDVLKRLKDL